MKTKFKILSAVALAVLAAAFLLPPAARAADYGVSKTIWSVPNFTNNPANATNLAAVVDCTQVTDFALHVKIGLTNVSTGTYDVRWTTSGDNSTFGSSPAATGSSGWFSIPLTGGGTVITWTTNIPVNSVGYWKFDWGTNVAAQHMTSVVMRAYAKPKRQNSDY